MNKNLNRNQAQRLGELLASIHQTLDGFNSSFNRPALNSEYLLDRSIQVITSLSYANAPLYKHRQNDINYLQTQIEKIKTQRNAFLSPT